MEQTEQETTENSVSTDPSVQSCASNLNAESNLSTPSDTSQGPISSIASCSGGGSFKRKKKLSASDQILAAVGDRLAQVKNKDRFDFFAKNVAAKLRVLQNNEQRIYAEKLINDVLFEAKVGSLTRYASINNGTGGYLTYNSSGPQPYISSGSSRDEYMGHY